MSVLYLHQKVTKRGYIAVVIMIFGAFVLFAGTIFGGGESANMTLGVIGGAMCAICWGLEGTFAGKALDYCEPDCGIQLRFFWEMVLWFIVCGVLAITGVPIFSTIASVVTDPYILLVVILLGFSFAWCYVTWYKSFPFIGSLADRPSDRSTQHARSSSWSCSSVSTTPSADTTWPTSCLL